jgi:membrane-bound metal-dependent hydrolase YbcI (DUF457 family)
MFVGHGLVAFAIVVGAGRRFGWPRERLLALGALAFAFATLPDVDILYALGGVFGSFDGPFAAASAFWATSTLVHRTVTHSLLVGGVAAVAFACWHAGGRSATRSGRVAAHLLALVLLGGTVAVGSLVSGALTAAILFAFAVAGLVVTELAHRRLSWLRPRTLGAVALVGLLTHPFGDLFTGEPPAMLYPLDVTLVAERLTLHPDPTLHLLAAFGLELLTVWLAVAVYLDLRGGRLRQHVCPRATLGLSYAVAALSLPAPTLEVSYHFVFSVLAVGSVGTLELRRGETGRRVLGDGGTDESDRRAVGFGVGLADHLTAFVTALAAVSFAVVGYTLTYLLLSP